VGRRGRLWDAARVFHVLTNHCQACCRGRGLALTTLEDEQHQQTVVACLETVSNLKRSRSGNYPVMAVSKNLHFYNPRLFVIYDTEIVFGQVYRVFRKDWSGCYRRFASTGDGWLDFYLAYLLWASRVIRPSWVRERFLGVGLRRAGPVGRPGLPVRARGGLDSWTVPRGVLAGQSLVAAQGRCPGGPPDSARMVSRCHRVTMVSRRCHEGVTRVSRGCHEGVTRVPDGARWCHEGAKLCLRTWWHPRRVRLGGPELLESAHAPALLRKPKKDGTTGADRVTCNSSKTGPLRRRAASPLGGPDSFLTGSPDSRTS
jgi:hypothetical protein